MRFRLRIKTSNIMKTTNHYAKVALLSLAVALFTATSARADTYSSTNFQSDIPGVAQHTDPNLINPWGMAAGATGTIWVSDNGTGVSTLYNQRSEEHTSELQSHSDLVCRLLLEKKKKNKIDI